MATPENSFVPICIIGLCVIAEAAIITCIAMLIIAIIKLVKGRKKNGK
jgi:hypothetical protein